MNLEIGIEIRKEILFYSLILENFTSIFLSTLLGIKNYERTKSFGNLGGSLSFNQKVDLLIDIGALDKMEKSKFIAFMEIRNQFAHNYNAKSYESCFKYLEGRETFILKTYPQDKELPREQQLKKAVASLAENVVDLTVRLLDKVEEKIRKDVESEMLLKFKNDTLQSITEIETAFNELYDKKKESGETSVAIDELKGMGSLVRRVFLALIRSKFDLKNKEL